MQEQGHDRDCFLSLLFCVYQHLGNDLFFIPLRLIEPDWDAKKMHLQ